MILCILLFMWASSFENLNMNREVIEIWFQIVALLAIIIGWMEDIAKKELAKVKNEEDK